VFAEEVFLEEQTVNEGEQTHAREKVRGKKLILANSDYNPVAGNQRPKRGDLKTGVVGEGSNQRGRRESRKVYQGNSQTERKIGCFFLKRRKRGSVTGGVHKRVWEPCSENTAKKGCG